MRLTPVSSFFFFNDTATTEIYTLSLHDALPICLAVAIDPCDGRLQALGLGGEPEELEHERGGQQRAGRIRDAAARDVRRGAVHRLEVRPAAVAEVGRGRAAEATGDLARDVGKAIAVLVHAHDDVHGLRKT